MAVDLAKINAELFSDLTDLDRRRLTAYIKRKYQRTVEGDCRHALIELCLGLCKPVYAQSMARRVANRDVARLAEFNRTTGAVLGQLAKKLAPERYDDVRAIVKQEAHELNLYTDLSRPFLLPKQRGRPKAVYADLIHELGDLLLHAGLGKKQAAEYIYRFLAVSGLILRSRTTRQSIRTVLSTPKK